MEKNNIDLSDDINKWPNKGLSWKIKIILFGLIILVEALLIGIIALAVKKNKVKEIIKYITKEDE